MPAYEDLGYIPPAPVARVTLRHPERGDTRVELPMLIDSGANATLLPKSMVGSLGIEGTGERYQLVAFDGTSSESEAVRVDLIFLNRRLRGRFLLMDADVGVIGRDVLNHLRLILDGPNLIREEPPSPAKKT